MNGNGRSDGFTLIEMIVITVIIGILAGIMVPSVIHYIDNGKEKNCEVNRKALLAVWQGDLAQNPSKALEEVLRENEVTEEILCPAGGAYSTPDTKTVRCSYGGHGEDGVVGESESWKNAESIVVNKPENPSEPTGPEEPEVSGDGCYVINASDGNAYGLQYRSVEKYVLEYCRDNPVGTMWGKAIETPPGYIWYDSSRGYVFPLNGNRQWIEVTRNEAGVISYQLRPGDWGSVEVGKGVLTGSAIRHAFDVEGKTVIQIARGDIVQASNGDIFIASSDDSFGREVWLNNFNAVYEKIQPCG